MNVIYRCTPFKRTAAKILYNYEMRKTKYTRTTNKLFISNSTKNKTTSETQ